MKRTFRTCLIAAGALLLPVVGLISVAFQQSAGASATPVGTSVTLNPTGGTTNANGLRIFYKGGELQVFRDGLGQLYHSATPTTTPTGETHLDNGVVLSIGATTTGSTGTVVYPTNMYWHETFTGPFTEKAFTSVTTTQTGTSFTSILKVTVDGNTYKVTLKVTYTSPASSFTVSYTLTVPVGNTKPVRLFHVMDTYLGSSDNGPGFHNTANSCAGETVGVSTPYVTATSATPSVVEAIIHKSGATWTGYASAFYANVDFGSTSTYGAGKGISLNDTITANTTTDNGMGVNWGPITSGTLSATNEFYFSTALPSCGANGYWEAGQDGGVYAFGGATFYGSLPLDHVTPSAPIVAIVATSDKKGYWLVGADGGVYAFGDAGFRGSLPLLGVKPAAKIVDMVATSDGEGYWLVGADGGVYAFGNASFFGSLPNSHVVPSSSIVSMAATTSDGGYLLVGADGGVFAFGDAAFKGSLPQSHVTPAKPIISISSTRDGEGYVMAAADGGVFAFGDGSFEGSLPQSHVTPAAPVVALEGTSDDGGYYVACADGGVFAFGSATFKGSLPLLGVTPAAPISGFAEA